MRDPIQYLTDCVLGGGVSSCLLRHCVQVDVFQRQAFGLGGDGVVMHYFKDKRELLVAAAQAVFDPFDPLLADATSDGFDGLRRLCVVPLPTTAGNEALWRIYAQALASAETEPAFAAVVRARYAAIRERVRALLAEGQRDGSLRGDFDPAAQCDILCALIDGLSLHAISEPDRFPPGHLETLVTQELEKLRS